MQLTVILWKLAELLLLFNIQQVNSAIYSYWPHNIDRMGGGFCSGGEGFLSKEHAPYFKPQQVANYDTIRPNHFETGHVTQFDSHYRKSSDLSRELIFEDLRYCINSATKWNQYEGGQRVQKCRTSIVLE